MQKLFLLYSLLFISFSTIGQDQNLRELMRGHKLIATQDALHKNDHWMLTSDVEHSLGGIWREKKVVVGEPFTTRFRFRASEIQGSGGDGFTLLIYNGGNPYRIGPRGMGLGYEEVVNSIAIEFDLHADAGEKGPHINIHSAGPAPNSANRSTALTDDVPIGNLLDGQWHDIYVQYGGKLLSVYIDDLLIPTLSIKLDINSKIELDDDSAWIGLVASHEHGSARYDIQNWMYNNVQGAPEVFENREVKAEKEITLDGPKVTILLWDNNKIDGDVVSLQLNNRWLLQEYTLKEEPIKIEIGLDEYTSFLIIHAHNLGDIPPNTAGLTVIDENGKEVFIMDADLRTSEALKMQYYKRN